MVGCHDDPPDICIGGIIVGGGGVVLDQTGCSPTFEFACVSGQTDVCPCSFNDNCNDENNVCTFDICLSELCSVTPELHGDTSHNDAGLACGPDGVVDLDDIDAVRDAYNGTFHGDCAFHNFDIQNDSKTCAADGVINLRDIFAVIFAKNDNPECCAGEERSQTGPGLSAGTSIALELIPVYTTLSTDRSVTVEIHASRVTDLSGYEIVLTVDGGVAGELILDSVDVDTFRDDYVFSGRPSFDATDAARSRLASALGYGGVTHDNRVYLGTFRFRATPNARGEFTIDVSQASMALDAGGRSMPITVEPSRLAIDR